MRAAATAVLFVLGVSAAARAESGYDLWLRYVALEDAAQRSAYRQRVTAIVVEDGSPAGRVVQDELRRGLGGLLGGPVPVARTVDADGGRAAAPRAPPPEPLG